MSVRSVVIGCGSYLPEKILTNKDLEKMVETNDQWIIERTGIKQRHIAATGEYTSDMASVAAKKALKKAGVHAEKVDLLIVATATPDHTFPATAVSVQAKIGAINAAAFDVQAVCAGFVYALTIAEKFLASGSHQRALVIGADMLSRLVDWEDRGTCILFGDGAGAVLLEGKRENSVTGILSSVIHSDGTTRDLLYVDGGASEGTVGKIRMSGKEVFKYATQKMADCTLEALHNANLTMHDVDWIVPHQANKRIMEAVAKKLSLPPEKAIMTVENHGNTSAASIPLALDTAVEDGRIQSGQILALQALGGGLSWGCCVIKW